MASDIDPPKIASWRKTVRLGFTRWHWWWSRSGEFAVPAPHIHTKAYQAALLGECDRAIGSGAVDGMTGDMFDRKLAADLATDLQQLTEERSRRTEILLGRERHHERRKRAALARATDLGQQLESEEASLSKIDIELANRHAPTVPAIDESSQNGQSASRAGDGDMHTKATS